MSEGGQSLRRGLVGGGAMLVVLALLFWFRAPLVGAMHHVDQRWLGEAITDTLSQLRGDEDWAQGERLARAPDYRWLQGAEPVRIAHALGESAAPTANTLGAVERSLARGFKHFEIDLWLEGERVRCHHGPPGPPPFKPGDCELGVLLQTLPQDAWLILDIKTDFVATGARALALAAEAGRTGQLIFQLYKPAHLHQFNRWNEVYPELPGPLVTAYLAHRGLSHVAAQVHRAGIGVLTVPMHRLSAYSRREPDLALFVHPVHDCESLQTGLQAGARGFYQLSSLRCPR